MNIINVVGLGTALFLIWNAAKDFTDVRFNHWMAFEKQIKKFGIALIKVIIAILLVVFSLSFLTGCATRKQVRTNEDHVEQLADIMKRHMEVDALYRDAMTDMVEKMLDKIQEQQKRLDKFQKRFN